MTGKLDFRKKKQAAGEYILPSLLTLTVFLSVLAVKGIYPFGSNTIDYYDMGQTNAPLYYHIWDAVHLKGNLFYTWYINEGQNLSMASAIQWNISVFNLFFLFIPRRLCFEMLSLFTGLRLFFMSFNMGIFLKKTVKAPAIYRMTMSLCYGLCGYVLTHYTITTYLDTAALIPLYMLSLYLLLKDDKDGIDRGGIKISYRAIFALSVGYMTALSYYLGFMNLIFILLISGTYIFLLSEKDKRAEKAEALVLSVVAGLCISAVILLPAGAQMTGSSRFNSNLSGGFLENVKNILNSVGADMYYIKWFMLSGCVAALVIIAVGLFRFRKERKTVTFAVLFCFYPCALIPFESINILWHLGTYYHYPIRCGYLIPFVLLTAGTYFCGRLFKDEEKLPSIREHIIYPVFSIVSAASLVFITVTVYNSRRWEIHELFNAWMIFACVMAVIYVLCLIIKRPDYIPLFIAAELVCAAYAGFGCPNFYDHFSSDPEQSGDYVKTVRILKDDMGIKESALDRIKNPDTELNANYGMVIRRATVGGWANTAERAQLEAAMAFGYNTHFMRIMDSGGTVFSDAMLHVTQILTCVPELYESEEYGKISEKDGFTLYDTKYVMPFVMKTGRNFKGENGSIMDVPAMTNAYYRELAKTAGIKNAGDILERYRGYEIRVKGRKALYLQGGESSKISVNGKTIPVPTMGSRENTAYPASFNSNLLYLGIYEDEDVSIGGIESASIMGLDLEKLDKLCKAQGSVGVRSEDVDAGGRTLTFKINAGEGECALLPLSYTKGFEARVNKKKARIGNIDSVFTGIELEPGENEVELKFCPYGLKTGAFLNLVGLVLTVILLHPFSNRKLGQVCLFLTGIAWAFAILLLYVVPLTAFIIHQVVKRLRF